MNVLIKALLFPQMTDDNAPLCRGLIHRTEAGWKHCLERFAGVSSGEPTKDAFKDAGEQEHATDPLNDDEYEHFYYFDGVLKRVQNNFHPYNQRQRRRKRSREDSENRGILHGYIQQLVLKNKKSEPAKLSTNKAGH